MYYIVFYFLLYFEGLKPELSTSIFGEISPPKCTVDLFQFLSIQNCLFPCMSISHFTFMFMTVSSTFTHSSRIAQYLQFSTN